MQGKLQLPLLSRFSCVRPCATTQTVAHQAPPSLGFSRQEHWSGLPFPSPMHACMLSCFSHVRLCATPWTAAHQAPLSTEFSRQECWSGLPFPLHQQSPVLKISMPMHIGKHTDNHISMPFLLMVILRHLLISALTNMKKMCLRISEIQ